MVWVYNKGHRTGPCRFQRQAALHLDGWARRCLGAWAQSHYDGLF